MTPRQFFDSVAEENARLAIAARHDLRLAINAIVKLDAFFGILHAALYVNGIGAIPPDDDKWKEQLASKATNTDCCETQRSR
jgi:hypothetical protein